MKLHSQVQGVSLFSHGNKFFINVDDLIHLDDELKTLITRKALISQPKTYSSAFIETVRETYDVYKGNKYIKTFGKSKECLYKVLVTRLNKGQTSEVDLSNAFSKLSGKFDTCLLEFLILSIPNLHVALIDWVYIMNKGMIANAGKEASGAKKLVEWVSNKTCTAKDIEDCWNWFTNDKKKSEFYSRSLTSIVSLLPSYINNNKQKEDTLEDLLEMELANAS